MSHVHPHTQTQTQTQTTLWATGASSPHRASAGGHTRHVLEDAARRGDDEIDKILRQPLRSEGSGSLAPHGISAWEVGAHRRRPILAGIRGATVLRKVDPDLGVARRGIHPAANASLSVAVVG